MATRAKIRSVRKAEEKLKKKDPAAYKRKRQVRNKITNAVRDGRLKKPTKCPNCGATDARIEWHHYSTSSPKGEWRCSKCNKRPGK